MTEKPKPAPTKAHDPWWYVSVIVACLCATALAIFVPDLFTKLERLIERLPTAAQMIALLGALTSAAALWRNRTRPLPKDGPSLLPLALGLSFAIAAQGCGASAVTRSSYALEQARCLANEREIIERVSTAEEDDRDMAIERARCDAALDAIEGGE